MTNPAHHQSDHKNGLLRRVTVNFSWTLVGEVTSRGAVFFMTLYLARILGVENFGLFTTVQTGIYYLWLSVDLGTNMYGIKEVSRYRNAPGPLISELLSLRIFASLAVYVCFVFSVALININPVTRSLLFAAGLYLVFYALYADWILKGLELFSDLAIGNIVTGTALLIGLIFFVKDSGDTAAAASVWSVSYLFGAASMWWIIHQRKMFTIRIIFTPAGWLRHLRASIFFTLSGALGMAYQFLPILLLWIFYGAFEIGIFSAPYKLVFTICTLGFFLPMSFYPILAHQHAHTPEQFNRTASHMRIVMLVIGVPLGAVGYMLGQNIVIMAYGEKYVESIYLFKILVWLIPIYFLRYTFGIPLNASGYQRYNTVGIAIGLLGMISIGLPLIKIFGVEGGAIALLISEVLTTTSMAYFYYKKLPD